MKKEKEEKEKNEKVKYEEVISAIEKEKEEYLNGWKKEKADFINYKKEETKRMMFFLELEKANLLLKSISVLDNFYRAEKEAEKRVEEDNLILGFLKIKEQIENFLKEEGVEEIKTENEFFDPNFHEAVEMVEEKDKESGKILEELEKGYLLNKKVIRPAKVKVIK